MTLTQERDRVIAALIKRRKALGISQRQLSVRLGYSGGHQVSKWETGEQTPHLGSLLAWSRALGCTIAVLDPAG